MKFLATLSALAVLLIIGDSAHGVCTAPRMRREVRELSKVEFDRFVNATKILHTKMKSNGYSIMENFSLIHETTSPYIHNNPAFLFWHREFMFQIETELKKIDPSVDLVYWDWTIDADEPSKSPILSEYMMGGNGDSNNDMCIKNGPYKGTKLKYGDDGVHCLRRDFDDGDSLSSFPPAEAMITLLNERRFSYFSKTFEVYHGSPHDGIGGNGGDFSTMYSPSDPLFYMHHTFIDFMISKWQDKYKDYTSYEGRRYGKTVYTRDYLKNFGSVRVRDVMNTRNTRYCYEYPSYPRVIPNPSYIPVDFDSRNGLNTNLLDDLPSTGIDNNITIELPVKSDELLSQMEDAEAEALILPIANNPFLASNDYEDKNIEQLTSALKKKYGRSRNGKGSIKRARQLSPKWVKMNLFSKDEVEEVFNITNQLIETLEYVPNYVPICDIQRKARGLSSRRRRNLGGHGKGGKKGHNRSQAGGKYKKRRIYNKYH